MSDVVKPLPENVLGTTSGLPSVPEAVGNVARDLGMIGLPPSLQILLDDNLYNRVKQLATLMSNAEGITPGHLIKKGEACFAIINMALNWKLDYQFVAKHTYQTPGGQIGYDGALTQAILEKSGAFVGAPTFQYVGDWLKLTGKFRIQEGQRGGKFAVPTWTSDDAIGLGVVVSWQVKGERHPRVWPGKDMPFWLVQCFPLNSPLWATDPRTQIAYLAIRRFGNLTSPGILGTAAFDHEDILDASDRARDITPNLRVVEIGERQTERESEPSTTFSLTDLDGVVTEFDTPDGALEALLAVLRGASKMGSERLRGAWESNEDLVASLPVESQRLAGDDFASLRDELAEADKRATQEREAAEKKAAEEKAAAEKAALEKKAADEKAAAEKAAAEKKAADEKAEADRKAAAAAGAQENRRPDPTPPASASAGTPASSSQATPASGAASPSASGPKTAATSASLSDGAAEELPKDDGNPVDPDAPDLVVPVPIIRGKPNYRGWSIALMQPKIKRCTTTPQLAMLLGQNDNELKNAERELSASDYADLRKCIDDQWKLVP